MENTCAKCKFWEPFEGLVDGSCHRFPPEIIDVLERNKYDHYREDFKDDFPQTTAADWCGEFIQKVGV